MTRPDEPTYQPERLIAGRCPTCRRLVVVMNNYETWPLVRCECGWAGATTEIAEKIRIDRTERRAELDGRPRMVRDVKPGGVL